MDTAGIYVDLLLTWTGALFWLVKATRVLVWLSNLPNAVAWLLWGKRRALRAYEARARHRLALAEAAREAKRLRRAARFHREPVTAVETELLNLPEEEAASRAAALPRKRGAASSRPADPH